MDDKSLYAAILGVKEPWGVESVELRLAQGEVHRAADRDLVGLSRVAGRRPDP